MPDVREVYEMVTKQKPPEPGALQRQQKRQVRTARNRKVGALAIAAAIGLVAVVLIWANRPAGDTSTPADTQPNVNSAVAEAEAVALGFVEAFNAFDAEQAMTYVADGADLTGVIDEQVPANEGGLSVMLSMLEAHGYRQLNTSCEAGTVDSETKVVCRFDFHAIRSDEIDRGPFEGSQFTFTMRDGKIVQATWFLYYLDEFSPQMWEPFRRWVNQTHPKDYSKMYISAGSNYRLTEESIRLWEEHSKEYVKEVNRLAEGQ